MPELPEVETIRKDLQKEVVGAEIIDFESDWKKSVSPTFPEFKEGVVGAKITSAERFAKILVLHLSNQKKILIHLKLSGQLLLRRKGDAEDKYVHHIFTLSANRELRFSDLRKFGYLKLYSEKELVDEMKKFGPEPLSSELPLEKFRELIRKRAGSIKQVLMNQSIISGLGNIYVNEGLYLAGINPKKPSSTLTESEIGLLYNKIELVLREGLKYRGASDNSYVDLYGRRGEYQNHFRVYGRRGEKCNKCKSDLSYEKIGGRGTFFCPKCQDKK